MLKDSSFLTSNSAPPTPDKATVIQMEWYGHKNRHIDPWARMDGPEISPSRNSQMIFYWIPRSRGEGLFSTNALGKLDPHMQKMKLDPNLTTSTKINSQWIRDLNIRVKSIKFLEEKIEQNFHNNGFEHHFLVMAPKTTKKKIIWIKI